MNDKYVAVDTLLSEIMSDPSFNCRGDISKLEVVDLAKDIKVRGLDQPIVLQPYNNPTFPEIKYRIVAGHRRHLAFIVNQDADPKVTTIPAFIRADLSEVDARLLNVRENIHRQDLNMKQEARALEFFLKYRSPTTKRHLFTEAELAEIFGQSRGWVQNRKALLMLPDDIQNLAAAGILPGSHIQKLSKIKNKDELYDTVRRIKDQKSKAEKILPTEKSIKRPTDIVKARSRKKHEIEELGEILYDTLGPGLHTRIGAWCAGNISTLLLMQDIQEYCKEHKIIFKMPAFISTTMMNMKQGTPYGKLAPTG